MHDYEQLRVWQQAHELLLEIYDVTRSFPRSEQFTLTAQIRRAALSIGSNLAEGCGRSSPRELRRFTEFASGSAYEVHYQLKVARDPGYLSDTQYRALRQKTETIQKMLRGFSRSLGVQRA